MSDRLRKLLGMLGSSFDGERANAAAMIARMAEAEGKTIADFVMSPQTIYRDRVVEKTVYRDRPSSEDDDFRSGLGERPTWKNPERQRRAQAASDAFHEHMRAGRHSALDPLLAALREARGADWLTPWEEEFIDDVLAAYRNDDDLSPRQRQVATKIKRKLERADEEPLI